MITKSTRPLTDNERKILLKNSSPSLANVFFAAAFTMIVIMLIDVALCRLFPRLRQFDKSPIAPLILLVPATIVGYKIYRREKVRFGKNPDLEQGIMEVLTVEATKAVKVEEFEDEGIGFYLDIGEGKVLFLQGQYLYDDETEHQFPCTRFTLMRAPYTGTIFDLKCEGTYFEPVHTNPAFNIKEYKTGQVPCDGQVLDVDFESLKKQ